jgi:hypothetical protein
MKIKTIFLFVCVSVTCLAVQFGIYRGIVKGAIDPCPQTTTKADIPCPINGQLIVDCSESVDCNGDEYVSYLAYTKNIGYKDNKPAETYTTVAEHQSVYDCAEWTKCVKNSTTDVCEPREGMSGINTPLYTVKNCSDN